MNSNRDQEVSNAGVAEVNMTGAGEGVVATMVEVEEEDTTTEVAEAEVVGVEEEEEVADITRLATKAIAARKEKHLLLTAVSCLYKEKSCTDPGLHNGMEPWLL